MEKYRDFAYYYDSLMYDVDYEAWYGFLREILEKEKMEYGNVLEMGCGTGNMSEQICRDDRVKAVTCFDLSEEMLIIAKEKLSGNANLDIIKQDMTDMNISKKFDLILSCCDSINYIVEEEDLEKVFQKSYELLNPGGALLFDINSYYKLSEIIGNNVFTEDREGVYYVWENEYEEETELCNFYLTFFIEDRESGSYSRFDEHHIERAYRVEKVIEILRNTGFESISTYCDFDASKDCGDRAERIFFLCKKA